jgi:hypothetical protein
MKTNMLTFASAFEIGNGFFLYKTAVDEKYSKFFVEKFAD